MVEFVTENGAPGRIGLVDAWPVRFEAPLWTGVIVLSARRSSLRLRDLQVAALGAYIEIGLDGTWEYLRRYTPIATVRIAESTVATRATTRGNGTALPSLADLGGPALIITAATIYCALNPKLAGDTVTAHLFADVVEPFVARGPFTRLHRVHVHARLCRCGGLHGGAACRSHLLLEVPRLSLDRLN